MKVGEARAYIIDRLQSAGIAEAETEARIILREKAGLDPTALHMRQQDSLDDDVTESILDVISRRVEREPLQYILGRWEFMGLEFHVDPSTLIPRSDTEILVECAMKRLHDGMKILDLCTGSGCILISLLKYSNDTAGVGTDISGEAINLAAENASAILDDMTRVTFVQGDLYRPVDTDGALFDMIVSNPPYIPSGVIPELEPEVRDHEPVAALDGGRDGLDLLRRIIDGAGTHLIPGGHLLCEIGFDQGEAVSELYRRAGFIDVEIVRDYAGLDRVVAGTLSILKDH